MGCQSCVDAAHWYRLLVKQSYIFCCFDCSCKLVRNFDQQFTSAPCKRLLIIEISQPASTYLNTVLCYREYPQFRLCKINRWTYTLMKNTYQLPNDYVASGQRNAAHLGVASIRHHIIVWVDSYRYSATAITTMREQGLWVYALLLADLMSTLCFHSASRPSVVLSHWWWRTLSYVMPSSGECAVTTWLSGSHKLNI